MGESVALDAKRAKYRTGRCLLRNHTANSALRFDLPADMIGS
jgi:hypothetical protein